MNLDFIVVGPQRTASSWLHLMLQQHPDISLPVQVKETMFWDKRYHKGKDWYEAFFCGGSGKRRGEVAPTLFPSKLARERLCQANRDTRIIILLRDPIERAVSHYRHERALGLQRGTLREAVQRDPRILEASRYSKYLPGWVTDFGRDRVFLVRQRTIEEKPWEVLEQLCGFLGIDEKFQFQVKEAKPSGASCARSPLLAGLFYRGASALRGIHWHRLVNLGKSLGIRKLLYTAQPESINPEDVSFLEETLSGEREFLESFPTNFNSTH